MWVKIRRGRRRVKNNKKTIDFFGVNFITF